MRRIKCGSIFHLRRVRMDRKQLERVFPIMREILYRAAERLKVVLQPNTGEATLFDAACRVLKNAGMIDYAWNPRSNDGTIMIGQVYISLTAGKLLAVLEERNPDCEVDKCTECKDEPTCEAVEEDHNCNTCGKVKPCLDGTTCWNGKENTLWISGKRGKQ
jgi:hypothetical protein